MTALWPSLYEVSSLFHAPSDENSRPADCTISCFYVAMTQCHSTKNWESSTTQCVVVSNLQPARCALTVIKNISSVDKSGVFLHALFLCSIQNYFKVNCNYCNDILSHCHLHMFINDFFYRYLV